MTRTVLFVLTNHDQLGETGRRTGAYAPEFAHPAEVFERAGYGIAFVSVNGGPVPLDGVTDDDQVTQSFLRRADVRRALQAPPTGDQLNAADYDVVYFAGGHGAMWDFRDCVPLARLAADIHDRGGVVSAVCHGPAGLLNIRLDDGSQLVDGREVSSFTTEEETAVGLVDTVPFLLEDALTERGAKHTKADDFAPYAVADGRLVTGQNPASAVRVAELIVREQHSQEHSGL